MCEIIRSYSGLPLRSIRPMVATTFAPTSGISLVGRQVGRLVVGALADVIGRFNSMNIITTITGVLTLATPELLSRTPSNWTLAQRVCVHLPGTCSTDKPFCGNRHAHRSCCTDEWIQCPDWQSARCCFDLPKDRHEGVTSYLGLQLLCGTTVVASVVAYGVARYMQSRLKWTKI
jgi:hypothetical protein